MPDARTIARRFFTRAEQTAVFREGEGPQTAHRFLMCWTLKEAVLKARGVGLSAPLNDFTVDFETTPPKITWHDVALSAEWGQLALAFLTVAPGYIGAVAVEGLAVNAVAVRSSSA